VDFRGHEQRGHIIVRLTIPGGNVQHFPPASGGIIQPFPAGSTQSYVPAPLPAMQMDPQMSAMQAPIASDPSVSALQLNSFMSLRATTFGSTDRFIRHTGSVGFTEVVTAFSDDNLKQDATWKIVPGLAASDCYSFESCNFSGQYLRHAWGRVRIDENNNSDLFKADATWRATFVPGGVRFASFNYPAAYLRHYNAELWIASLDGSRPSDAREQFTEDTTWAVSPPLGQPVQSNLQLWAYQSFQITTPETSTRFMVYRDTLGFSDVVTTASDFALKQAATWRIVPGLAGTGCYSFESCDKSGHYLRHAGGRLRLHAKEDSDLYRADASFRPEFTPNGIRFKSFNYPTCYLRQYDSELWVTAGDGTSQHTSRLFVEDSTWVITMPWGGPQR
jgi:Alpha-L-arabinofuranosidase B (ABFB) domain